MATRIFTENHPFVVNPCERRAGREEIVEFENSQQFSRE